MVYHSNLILLDINRDINSVYSGPLDTSFGDTNRDEFNITQTMSEKTVNTMTPPLVNKKMKVKVFVKTLEKGKTLMTPALTKLLKMLETKNRWSLNYRRKESCWRQQVSRS